MQACVGFFASEVFASVPMFLVPLLLKLSYYMSDCYKKLLHLVKTTLCPLPSTTDYTQ